MTIFSNLQGLSLKSIWFYRIVVASICIYWFLSSSVLSASSQEKLDKAQILATSVQQKIHISRQEKGVDAALIKGNAYYIRKDGKRVQYLRKKNLHFLDTNKISSLEKRQFDILQEKGLIEKIDQAKAGGRVIFRLKDESVGKSAVNKLLTQSRAVFANEDGDGDIAVLPRVTVKLSADSEPQKALEEIDKLFGLSVKRQLKLSGNVYSLAIPQQMSEPDQVFSLVRALHNSSLIDWAEPQFNAKPIKHAFTNDALFSNQWHLNNTTQNGALCDADCDATLAWDTHTGAGKVIAIIDDGVQLDHPDLQANIWVNIQEQNGVLGVDDDGNGYIDDINGYDFVSDTDDQGASCFDGVIGPDSDPSPQDPGNCLNTDGETVREDDDGTAVAGIAAARGNNGIGVTGLAYQAKILPIRAFSDYDSSFISQGGDFCTRIAEAMTYAGRHADVVNNSWEMQTNCMALEAAIDDVVAGTIQDGGVNVSKRPNKGSPVIFSAGNSAAGWYKVTVDNVSAGEREFEWRFTRSAFYDPFRTQADTVWIDNIQWPDGSVESFEGNGFNDFNTGCDINQCTLIPGLCSLDDSGCDSIWQLNNDPTRSRGGSGRSLQADLSSDFETVCDYTYLTTKREMTGGSVSFWIWASADFNFDNVEFLVDGVEQSSFGDLPQFVNNDVSYPASLNTTIAVGASTDGIFMDSSNANHDLSKEERVYYSQFGSALDILAPSSNQHQGVTTTDREGVEGFNSTTNLSCSTQNSDCDYTDYFYGTSAAAPMVSAAAAIILQANDNLTATQVRAHLQNGAEQIGPYLYPAGVSEEAGHGRLNVFNSLRLAQGLSVNFSPLVTCLNPESFSLDSVYAVIDKQDRVFEQCESQVFVPEPDELCFPIKAKNGNVAVICL